MQKQLPIINDGDSIVPYKKAMEANMKKFGKILVAVLMLATLVGACFAFTACNKTEATKVKVIDIELTEESYAFALKKGDTVMADAANSLLAELKANGELDNIVNAFFEGTATFTYENPASKDGCLVVATNAQFPPFEYKQGNKFTGVDIQIAKLLADKLGKTLYVDDMDFDAALLSVSGVNPTADLAMAGITVNEERLKTMDFTDTYYTSAQVIIVKENDKTFDNCKTAADVENILKAQSKSYTIGTQNGTTGFMYSNGDEGFGYDGFGNLTTAGYQNGALAVQDLSKGKINAVIIDKQPALMISKSVNANIK